MEREAGTAVHLKMINKSRVQGTAAFPAHDSGDGISFAASLTFQLICRILLKCFVSVDCWLLIQPAVFFLTRALNSIGNDTFLRLLPSIIPSHPDSVDVMFQAMRRPI